MSPAVDFMFASSGPAATAWFARASQRQSRDRKFRPLCAAVWRPGRVPGTGRSFGSGEASSPDAVWPSTGDSSYDHEDTFDRRGNLPDQRNWRRRSQRDHWHCRCGTKRSAGRPGEGLRFGQERFVRRSHRLCGGNGGEFGRRDPGGPTSRSGVPLLGCLFAEIRPGGCLHARFRSGVCHGRDDI